MPTAHLMARMTFVKLLEEAAAPFFLDRRGVQKILVGLLLSLVPVVSFFSLGYVLTVLKSRMEGRREGTLPEWRSPEQLFLRGVVFFMVILTYASLPFIFTSASFAMLKMGFVFLPPAIITLVISAALWLAALFILPLSMALFLRRKTVSAIFDLEQIWQRSFLNLNHYLQATLVNLVLLAATSLPAVVNPVGYLFSSPLTFLTMVYMASVYGLICGEVVPGE